MTIVRSRSYCSHIKTSSGWGLPLEAFKQPRDIPKAQKASLETALLRQIDCASRIGSKQQINQLMGFTPHLAMTKSQKSIFSSLLFSLIIKTSGLGSPRSTYQFWSDGYQLIQRFKKSIPNGMIHEAKLIIEGLIYKWETEAFNSSKDTVNSKVSELVTLKRELVDGPSNTISSPMRVPPHVYHIGLGKITPRTRSWIQEAAKHNITFTIGNLSRYASPKRKALMANYSQHHYGVRTWRLRDPQALIIHSTNTPSHLTKENIRGIFTQEELPDERYKKSIQQDSANRVNIGSHFVVYRDGHIEQLAPLDFMCRHAVGMNWTALGIEVVSNPSHHYTDKQLESVAWLTKKIMDVVVSVEHILPHHDYHLNQYQSLVIAKGSNTYTPTHYPKQDPYGDDFLRVKKQILMIDPALQEFM